jgi:hypothetical protein
MMQQHDRGRRAAARDHHQPEGQAQDQNAT